MLPDRPPINVASCCDLPVGIVRWGDTDRRVTAIVKATLSLQHERAWLAFQQAELSVDRASPFSPEEPLDAFAEDAALDLDGLLRGAPRRTVSLGAPR